MQCLVAAMTRAPKHIPIARGGCADHSVVAVATTKRQAKEAASAIAAD